MTTGSMKKFNGADGETALQKIENTEAGDQIQKARLQYGKDDMITLKETFFKGASDAEVKVALMLAATYGLDPFLREIWWVDKIGLMCGRDGYLKAAKNRSDFEGLLSGPIYKGANIQIDYEKGIVNCEITAEMLGNTDKPVAAWAVAKRKGFPPVIKFARWSEYAKSGPAWNTYQTAMIVKCAESMALRHQFGITGLVPDEEASQEREMVNVTPGHDLETPFTTEKKTRKPRKKTKTVEAVAETEKEAPPAAPDLSAEVVHHQKEVTLEGGRDTWLTILTDVCGDVKSVSDMSESEKKEIIAQSKSFLGAGLVNGKN